MTTQRAIVFLLVVGGLVLFAMQNASPPPLSLVVFGIRTQPMPLSFWLVGAIALGVITTLLMVGLLNLVAPDARSKSPRKGRYRAASYGKETSYRTTPESESSGRRPSDSPRDSVGAAATSPSSPSGGADPLDAQDWETFKSPEQWDDWGQRPDPSVAANTSGPTASNRNKSKRQSRREKEQYAAEESYEEIAGGWDGYEENAYKESAYSPRGGSSVEDALDDIAAGWDDYDDVYGDAEATPPPPPKDYEAQQSPKTVYRSGSLYSYSYDKSEASESGRDKDADSFDELEDEIDLRDELEYEDYPTESERPTDNRKPSSGPGPGRVGPDGVYEADYRVIIPPVRNLEDEDDWEGR